MKRREFIAVLAGAGLPSLWLSGARAQPSERMRVIGVLMAHAEADPEFVAYLATSAGARVARGPQHPNPHLLGRARRRGGAPAVNATGFTVMEPTIAGKWLELLKEIAPHVKRAA